MNNSTPFFDGHLLATGGVPETRSRLPPVPVQVGMTIGKIFLPYVLALGLFGSMVTLSLTFLPDSRERAAIGTFGLVAFIGTMIVSYYEWVDYERKHAPEPKPKETQPAEIVITKENSTGYNQRTIRVPNPPSQAFIVAVHRSRQSTGRIPGERFFEDVFQDRADGWLDILEQLDIVQKIGDYETSPRRWSDHWTLNKALAVFGYPPVDEPPQPVPQVPPQQKTVREQPPATPKAGAK